MVARQNIGSVGTPRGDACRLTLKPRRRFSTSGSPEGPALREKKVPRFLGSLMNIGGDFMVAIISSMNRICMHILLADDHSISTTDWWC